MRRGDLIDLRAVVAPIEYYDTARLSVFDQDYYSADDHYGTRAFFGGIREGIHDYFYPSPLNARYRVQSEIRREPEASLDGSIQLLSLRCDDAQGTRDEITLLLNDIIIAGPMQRMRTGWTLSFEDELEYHFRRVCVVTLRDTFRQDWERSNEIVVGDYTINTDYSMIFSASGSGVAGDAHYTLRYRMLA